MEGICPVCKRPHGQGTVAACCCDSCADERRRKLVREFAPRTDDPGVDGRDWLDLPGYSVGGSLRLNVLFNRSNPYPAGRRVFRAEKAVQ